MKHLLFLVLMLTLYTKSSFSQKSAAPLETQLKFDLALQGFGMSVEHPLHSRITIECSLGAGGGYEITDDELGYKYRKNFPAFYIGVNPRYYYNRDKMSEKGKATTLNSGNYFGLKAKLNSAIIEHFDISSPAILTNLHWGIQKAIGTNFLIDFRAGLGYAHNLSSVSGTLYPTLDLKLSYVFLKGSDWFD